MQKYTYTIAVLAVLMSAILITTSFSPKQLPLYDLPQMVKPPKIKDAYSFAGESIPMNLDTRERIERELLTNSYFHTSTVLAIKNMPKYFPMMEQILAEEGVPDDFKYLAVAESNMSNATSPAGAKGLWQFMKGTASDYGLEVSLEVEERFNYEKATKAACRYIKFLKNQTGSWANAAAAYNMGLGNFQKTASAQGERSYFDMNLNEETARYLFRIIALKEILSAPESFGFLVESDQRHLPLNNVREVTVNSSILNLGDYAHQNGVTYRMLKYYNPWLIDNKLTFKGKDYTIKLPN